MPNGIIDELPRGILGEETPPPVLSQFPYDRVNMVRTVRMGTLASGQPRMMERPVARTIDEAMQMRYDYWHPGGEIRDSSGRILGTRPRGWFVDGYKWQDDLPQNKGEDNLPLDVQFGMTKVGE